ncbi:MAG: serine hydrolase [Acidobacteriota bacterium]
MLLCFAATTAAAVTPPPDPDPQVPSLDAILRGHPGLAPLLEDAEALRLQVLLGTLEEGSGGPRLVQQGFRADAEYTYPASTIKLCAAVAALQELERLRRKTGLAVDADTPLVFHPLFDDEVLERHDPDNRSGQRITVRQEIRELFLVSDNTAFNRLYELVGPAALNRSMHRAGLPSTHIVHRLSEARSPEEQLRLPRIDLAGDGFVHTLPRRVDPPPPTAKAVPGLRVGRGYLTHGASGPRRVDGPMDFATKNRMSLRDLQRALAMVVRPDLGALGGPGFGLTDDQGALLLEPMYQLPRESKNPVYDPTEYTDQWVKFLLPGLERVLPKSRLRIYNKIGRAYGFSTENAYVVDTETGRGFFLAATIYTNRDGILNDDRYEYEQVADPFFADLGEAVARALWPDRFLQTDAPR